MFSSTCPELLPFLTCAIFVILMEIISLKLLFEKTCTNCDFYLLLYLPNLCLLFWNYYLGLLSMWQQDNVYDYGANLSQRHV
jgi:hypothetical protein